MKLGIFLYLVLIFQSCSHVSSSVPKEIKKIEVKTSKLSIRPGEARWLEITGIHENVELLCRGKVQKLNQKQDKLVALIVESYFSNFEKFNCELKVSGNIYQTWEFEIKSKKFPSEKLRVNPRTIKLSEPDQKRVEEEQIILNKIYSSSANDLYFQKPFLKPLSSRVTSYYGMRRIYNNQKKGQHLGIDFRAPIGIQIPATNRGKIVFSGDLFYTGKTIIIDHGLDIFTVYGHLSENLVKSGDIVERGDIVGLSGNTGRSSGPHLHWGVKIQGEYVDGFALIDETKKFLND